MIARAAQRTAPIAGFLVLWELTARAELLPSYLSSPGAIVAAYAELIERGELWGHIAASTLRTYAGFALGALAGVVLGLASGISQAIRSFFDPLVALLYPIPKIAFLPIAILAFGLGSGSKVAIVGLTVFFPVFIAANYGVGDVTPQQIWAARSMGAGRFTIFRRVILPASLPQVFAGLRVGLALAFVVLFATELMASRIGLGNLILVGEEFVRFDIMFVGITSFAVVGFVSDRLLMATRARLLRGQIIGTAEAQL